MTDIEIGDRVKVIETKSPYYQCSGNVINISTTGLYCLDLQESTGGLYFSRKNLVKLSYDPVPRYKVAEPIPDESFDEKVRMLFDEARDLLLKKHHDYGPKNISNSPGGPLNGLRVRIHDKLARIDNLTASGSDPENEALRDSWMDSMNYFAIGILVQDGDWPD